MTGRYHWSTVNERVCIFVFHFLLSFLHCILELTFQNFGHTELSFSHEDLLSLSHSLSTCLIFFLPCSQPTFCSSFLWEKKWDCVCVCVCVCVSEWVCAHACVWVSKFQRNFWKINLNNMTMVRNMPCRFALMIEVLYCRAQHQPWRCSLPPSAGHWGDGQGSSVR